MDELGLIRWVRKRMRKSKGVVLGIGDDAAVVRFAKGRGALLKADMTVENVHFDPARSSEKEWGRKAVNRNVSDIAAMGGVPRFALVSLAVPASCSLKRAKAIMAGVEAACEESRIQIVGGDTSRSERIVISVALAGEVKGRPVTRSGARPGDFLFVTGRLGGSYRSGKHLRFRPRLRESQFLSARYPIHAMIDVSDGLSKDLGHLAEESGVGLRILESAVPLNPGVKDVKRAFTDGEDFELVFALSPRDAFRLRRDPAARRKKMKFYSIGCAVPRGMGLRIVRRTGLLEPFPKPHDHHFGN